MLALHRVNLRMKDKELTNNKPLWNLAFTATINHLLCPLGNFFRNRLQCWCSQCKLEFSETWCFWSWQESTVNEVTGWELAVEWMCFGGEKFNKPCNELWILCFSSLPCQIKAMNANGDQLLLLSGNKLTKLSLFQEIQNSS